MLHAQIHTPVILSRIKARFPLPELTGDRFPLPVNTGWVDGRALPLLTARSPVNSGRQLG